MIPVSTSGGFGGGPDDRLTTLRSVLLRLGRARLGAPPPDIESRIGRITDEAYLEQLLDRIVTVCRWAELLAEV